MKWLFVLVLGLMAFSVEAAMDKKDFMSKADRDGNGVLTKKEYLEQYEIYCKEKGWPFNRDRIEKQMFDIMDDDGNGELSQKEFYRPWADHPKAK